MALSDKMISVVCLSPEDASGFGENLRAIVAAITERFRHFEVVVVDNGRYRDAAEVLKSELAAIEHFRVIFLSQDYGTEIGLSAGIEAAIGDYVVMMEPGSDPASLIGKMIDLCEAGVDYVVGRRSSQPGRTGTYRLLARIYYAVSAKLLRLPFDHNWSNFVCLSRPVANSIAKVRKRVRFLKFIAKEVGYSHSVLNYDVMPSVAQSTPVRVTADRVFDALQAISAVTDRPLLLASTLAFLIAGANLIYLLYSLAVWIVLPDVAKGWTSTNMFLSAMFSALFLFVGTIAQYLSVVVREVTNSPLYYVVGEIHSGEIFGGYAEKNVECSDEFSQV